MNKVRPLHVLQIAPGDIWAGAEVQLYNLARTLHSRDDTLVSVILLNHGPLEMHLINAGIECIIIDENTFSSFGILLRLMQLIRKQQPDIIHTHISKINILGSIAAYITGRIPSVKTVHGSQEHPASLMQIKKHMKLFSEWLCGRFLQQKVIAVSKNLAGILAKDFPADRIIVIENGIDSASLIESLGNTVRSPGKVDGSLKVGIAGRLVPIKRLDLFIKTAHYFKKHYPNLDASFHIYGDGPLCAELEMLNQKLKTNDIVHFEGHCDNMPEKLRELDALLMTSDHEGLPMILLEAMTLETPIIAHAVGGIPNLLDQGKCGKLVKEHNDSGYAKALYELLNSPANKQVITQNALNRVSNIYSAEKNAKKHLQLYKKICSHC